jgi:hypothetical protein
VSNQREGAGSPSDEEAVVPDAIARILATAVIGTVIGAAVTKIFGKKAGFVAFILSATAHEMFDAPLAQRLSRLGL